MPTRRSIPILLCCIALITIPVEADEPLVTAHGAVSETMFGGIDVFDAEQRLGRLLFFAARGTGISSDDVAFVGDTILARWCTTYRCDDIDVSLVSLSLQPDGSGGLVADVAGMGILDIAVASSDTAASFSTGFCRSWTYTEDGLALYTKMDWIVISDETAGNGIWSAEATGSLGEYEVRSSCEPTYARVAVADFSFSWDGQDEPASAVGAEPTTLRRSVRVQS